jgi:hypothetical protein
MTASSASWRRCPRHRPGDPGGVVRPPPRRARRSGEHDLGVGLFGLAAAPPRRAHCAPWQGQTGHTAELAVPLTGSLPSATRPVKRR